VLRRTTVVIEIDAFEEAKTVLGTRGYRDTVNGALREFVRFAKLRRLNRANSQRRGSRVPVTREKAELIGRNRY